MRERGWRERKRNILMGGKGRKKREREREKEREKREREREGERERGGGFDGAKIYTQTVPICLWY